MSHLRVITVQKSSLSSKAILKGHQEVLIFQSPHKKAQQVCNVVLPHLYVEFIVRYVKIPKQHRLTQCSLLIQAQTDSEAHSVVYSFMHRLTQRLTVYSLLIQAQTDSEAHSVVYPFRHRLTGRVSRLQSWQTLFYSLQVM